MLLPLTSIFPVLTVPVPFGLSSKSLFVTLVLITLVSILISSACTLCTDNVSPAISATNVVESKGVSAPAIINLKLSDFGSAVTLVCLSDEYTPPNVTILVPVPSNTLSSVLNRISPCTPTVVDSEPSPS